ncbi:hypothetical protein DSCA_26990 [Desulfosarcina alkanivorans]|uniref:Uncharacterized protein n=3 Tax=Desulfosarcina alkanivorans TaxID=571177 RepID=A0A5K7YLR2_9BACT|nr:hypothetical protein DSCA_26990 [Desulfosarcina alkanivorans]
MKKHIEVFTNDATNPRIRLAISGSVLSFAKMEPRYARLVGPAGTDIKRAITITPEKAYPFKILRAKARNGKDIAFEVKTFSKAGSEGYVLTIENKKTVAGRYADTVVLTTDSQIKPTITIPVYGQIISTAPQPAPATTKKSAGDG